MPGSDSDESPGQLSPVANSQLTRDKRVAEIQKMAIGIVHKSMEAMQKIVDRTDDAADIAYADAPTWVRVAEKFAVAAVSKREEEPDRPPTVNILVLPGVAKSNDEWRAMARELNKPEPIDVTVEEEEK